MAGSQIARHSVHLNEETYHLLLKLSAEDGVSPNLFVEHMVQEKDGNRHVGRVEGVPTPFRHRCDRQMCFEPHPDRVTR